MSISTIIDNMEKSSKILAVAEEKDRIIQVILHQITTASREQIVVLAEAEQIQDLKNWCKKMEFSFRDGRDNTCFYITFEKLEGTK